MIAEVKDQFELLQMVHKGIDGMVAGLTDEQMVQKPGSNFNNIASLLAHILLTEERFLAGLSGGNPNIDIMAPFSAASWDVSRIRSDWGQSLKRTESVLSALTESDLPAPGLTLHSGMTVNKRQIITFMVLHAAHHRGQIPLVKKLLQV